ncbi:MAG TPA: biotin synthase BioB [Armatimonadota bacterium]|jgi:biotin synthase
MNITEALSLYDLPLSELSARADRTRREHTGDTLELCTILNARSGRCGEDCRFCAQSAHYATGAAEYPLLPREDILAAARRAGEIGSDHFCIVSSGRALTGAEFDDVVKIVADIRQQVGIEICCSMGCLTPEQLARLRDAGSTRFQHNLETSRRFFPRIVTTHTYDDRVRTVRAAKELGFSVCSGGIIGLGETREDRISMALDLQELNVDVVPVNALMPIPGTPLADREPISPIEVLKTIAIFRLLLPEKTIKLAGGRESVLKEFQATAFLSGANGMIIGGYLTQRGRAVEDDQRMVEEIRSAWKS